MISANVEVDHSFGVQTGTRNHKGYFVPYGIYQLIDMETSGWALICQDNATCHYVDPDNLRQLSSFK